MISELSYPTDRGYERVIMRIVLSSPSKQHRSRRGASNSISLVLAMPFYLCISALAVEIVRLGIYQNALMTSSSQVRWLSEAETRSLGTYPAWFDEYLLARCDRLQAPEVARDATATTREKSACAMRVIQDHRRQARPAPPTAPPPATD